MDLKEKIDNFIKINRRTNGRMNIEHLEIKKVSQKNIERGG